MNTKYIIIIDGELKGYANSLVEAHRYVFAQLSIVLDKYKEHKYLGMYFTDDYNFEFKFEDLDDAVNVTIEECDQILL